MPDYGGLSALAIPDYARPDLAFAWTQSLSAVSVGSQANYMVSGAFIELIQAVFVAVTTSVVVGNRTLTLEVITPNDGGLFSIPANVSQPENRQDFYSFGPELATAYTGLNVFHVAPIPSLLLEPGSVVRAKLAAPQAGDQFDAFTLSLLRIPTGPRLQNATPIPTPIRL